MPTVITDTAPARVIPVGLLGFGLAGSVFHAPVIEAVPQLAIVSVMTSRIADVARDLPAARVVPDAQAIFDDPQIELVVVATPNTTHAGLAHRALRAGKHVVIDKPMTVTSRDADLLVRLADDLGRLLSVYQIRRWDGDFLTVGNLIAQGRLGHVSLFEARYDRFRPAIKPGWREERQPGSGLLYDLGSHLIDQALTLFGLPETVTADVVAQRRDAAVDDYFAPRRRSRPALCRPRRCRQFHQIRDGSARGRAQVRHTGRFTRLGRGYARPLRNARDRRRNAADRSDGRRRLR